MSNIAIVTCYTSNIADLVEPLSKNKQAYCDKWEYKFFLEIWNQDEKTWINKHHMPFGMYRMEFILRLMKQYPNIEWFVWMDNDAFIMNFTIPLSSFIPKDADFVIGEDWNGINSGVFFVRNNENGRTFLENICNFIPSKWEGRPYWWAKSEQCAITHSIGSVKTYIYHHSLFNGYLIGPRPDNDWGWAGLKPFDHNWKPKQFSIGDFVLHLVGTHNEEKQAIIIKYLKEVIK